MEKYQYFFTKNVNVITCKYNEKYNTATNQPCERVWGANSTSLG
jgi:hypothetical protein